MIESIAGTEDFFTYLILTVAEVLIVALIVTMTLFEWLRTRRNSYGLLVAILTVSLFNILLSAYIYSGKNVFTLDRNVSVFFIDTIEFIVFLFLGPALLYRFIYDVRKASFLLIIFAGIGLLLSSTFMVIQYLATPLSRELVVLRGFMPLIHLAELSYPFVVLTGSWPWILKFSGFNPEYKLAKQKLLIVPFLLFSIHKFIEIQNSMGLYEIRRMHLYGEGFTALAFFSIMILVYKEIINELTENYENATKDKMTGLLNYGFLIERLSEEAKRIERYGGTLSLAMIDIDHFKNFNDDFGHLAGDELLKELAKTMKKSVRDSDLVFRYGGEEFAVLLLGSTIGQAKEVMERLRENVTRLNIRRPVTISVGISGLECACIKKDSIVPENLIHSADKALYTAKEQGRNRVVICKEASEKHQLIVLDAKNKQKEKSKNLSG